jgi:hypothetical protein
MRFLQCRLTINVACLMEHIEIELKGTNYKDRKCKYYYTFSNHSRNQRLIFLQSFLSYSQHTIETQKYANRTHTWCSIFQLYFE